MLANVRSSAACTCRSFARRSSALGVSQRHASSSSARAAWQRTPQSSPTATWSIAVIGSAAAAAAAYSLANHVRPDLAPLSLLPEVQAESPVSVEQRIDPTSSTPFPTLIRAPDGSNLKLVGTGVRTVSFLGIRVYAAGFYVDERAMDRIASLEGFRDYSPDKLLPPFPKPDQTGVYGEKLMSKLLDVADVAIVIVPLRNTNLPHLRDGFARGLMARLKLPHVVSDMTEAENESTPTAITEMKGFFPGRTLPAGSALELYYSASQKQIKFQMRNKRDGPADVLGSLTHAKLARELVLSYFSDSLETSPELRKSVAEGLAGERVTAVM